MSDNSNKRKALTPHQVLKAHEAAVLYYYSSRLEDGSLDSQKNVALNNLIDPPRFSEALKDAWRSGIIDVIVHPPSSAKGATKFKQLELKVHDKLKKFSPLVYNDKGNQIRKFRKVHIVPAPAELSLEAYQESSYDFDLFTSLRTRICKKAALEFQMFVHELYKKSKAKGDARFYCGIGWGRMCEGVVTFMSISPEPYSDLIVCPLIGIMGHKDTPLDANFLAYELGTTFSGDAIKLPCPCLRPFELGGLRKLRPIARALEEINCCQLGLSGVAPVYNRKGPVKSSLIERKMLREEQLKQISDLGAVAELCCHYFDIHGRPIPKEKLGFEPMGIQIKQMQRMERFMVVVSPQKEKILPAVVTVKAGICSDLVIDHRMAYYILDDNNEKELRLRVKDSAY